MLHVLESRGWQKFALALDLGGAGLLFLSFQLNNAQADFRSGKVCSGAGGHALLLLATSR